MQTARHNTREDESTGSRMTMAEGQDATSRRVNTGACKFVHGLSGMLYKSQA